MKIFSLITLVPWLLAGGIAAESTPDSLDALKVELFKAPVSDEAVVMSAGLAAKQLALLQKEKSPEKFLATIKSLREAGVDGELLKFARARMDHPATPVFDLLGFFIDSDQVLEFLKASARSSPETTARMDSLKCLIGSDAGKEAGFAIMAEILQNGRKASRPGDYMEAIVVNQTMALAGLSQNESMVADIVVFLGGKFREPTRAAAFEALGYYETLSTENKKLLKAAMENLGSEDATRVKYLQERFALGNL